MLVFEICFVIFAFLLLLASVVFCTLVVYARWYRGTLEECGVQVIKPHWFLGSNYEAHNKIQPYEDMDRMKKFGYAYGVYDGRQPTIYISDPALLKKIQLTDFENFRNHRLFLIEHPVFSEILDFLDDDKWKEVRSTLTPHFTSGKIRVMCDTISDIGQDYVSALKTEMEANGETERKMDFRRYAIPLILEIIGKIFCGIDIQNARDPNNEFVKNMKLCLGGDVDLTMDWTFTLGTALPFMARFFPVFPPGSMEVFAKTMTGIFEARKANQIYQQDMVNTLLEMTKRSKTDDYYRELGITGDTAIGQAFEFFIASYEAVRSQLTFLIYYLAVHPEIQERLRIEIDDVLDKHENTINWETVAELPYLTACLTESMRLQPGFFRPDRRCTKNWEHNGLKIKKDMIVIFPIWAIHRDPASYLDPETFDPERFMPGKKELLDPYSFGMFGNGPRACIGKRFSYQMLKIIMVHYLKDFTIEKRSDTELNYVKGNALFLQTSPIYVNFVLRQR